MYTAEHRQRSLASRKRRAAEGWPERVLGKVRRGAPDECWQWQGRTVQGYGMVTVMGKNSYAHRVVYELEVGPIPDALTIDHLCRNRACVNPAHLEPVTARENTLRGEAMSARWARRTHCNNGHDAWRPRKSGGRWCIECQRERRAA